jgi:hypothetical protein
LARTKKFIEPGNYRQKPPGGRVAARRQTAANLSVFFRWRRSAETPLRQIPLVAPTSDAGGRELFSGIQFGMDDWGYWRLNFNP